MATTNQGWALPTVGGSQDTWGATLNTTIQAIDTLVGGVSAAEIAKLDGMTASQAELNKLTGVTWSLTGFNALTATVAELNYVDGVTSAIQTQLDGKQPLDATLTGLSGLATGASKIPYSTGTDTFSQLDFKDEDSMASNSATAVPSQQSVKAYVDGLSVGVGQSWQNMSSSRTVGTSYRNTTGKPIMVLIEKRGGGGFLELSSNGSTWLQAVGWPTADGSFEEYAISFIVPDDHYYRISAGGYERWHELR